MQSSPARARALLLLAVMAVAGAWVLAWSSARPAEGVSPQVTVATTEPVTQPVTSPTTEPATTRPTVPRTTVPRRASTTKGPSTTPPSTVPTTVAGTLPPTTAGPALAPATTAADGSRPGEGKMPAWPMVLSGVGAAGAAGILGGKWMRTRNR